MVTITGFDELVDAIEGEVDRIRHRAPKVVEKHIEEMAQKMRDHVPVGEGTTLESITADEHAAVDGNLIWAEAGPEWFVGRFIEHGTVKMPPRPFVDPAADGVLGAFGADLLDATGL